MTDQGLRVALYARISEDGTGERVGVERQLRDAASLAELRGWRVVEKFHDNDISALHGARRPGYEALLTAVERGDVDRVVLFQTSRLWRNRTERARDIDRFAAARVGIVACKGPELDLSTAYGRAMAGLLGEFDTMESEVKSERVAAAAADRARRGMPNGGLGYGWRKDEAGEWVIEPTEAEVVREVTDRLLAGDSIRAVTIDLNERQVPPPGAGLQRRQRGRQNPDGTLWGTSSVKKLATRPANAALRVHRRGTAEETMTEGRWPAIVPRERWERVAAKFAPRQGSGTNGTTKRPGARRHMLTYSPVGGCGVCGGPLRVRTMRARKPTHSDQVLYVCDNRPKSCVGRNQAKVDELVREVVVARLSRPDALTWLAGDSDRAREAGERADALRKRLELAADAYTEGRLEMDQLERITAKTRPLIAAAEAERVQHLESLDPQELEKLAGPRAREYWDGLSAVRRNKLLLALGVRVLIDRTPPSGGVFRPESVRIEWGRDQ